MKERKNDKKHILWSLFQWFLKYEKESIQLYKNI